MIEEIEIASDFSGIGCFEQALKDLGVSYKKTHACDYNKYSRRTFLLNNGTPQDIELLKDPDVKFIDNIYWREFLGKKMKKPTPDEWDRVAEIHEATARRFSFYYPWDVYRREIPEKPIRHYMTSPPCQAFSLAGKRLGKADLRGVLFFNSLEYIRINKPESFTFENVKGLLSDNKKDSKDGLGQTFTEWLTLLGGKSVNGNQVMFPHEDSVPYHVYWKVLNSVDYNVPQNRDRVFIVGIRSDIHDFTWPKEVPLTHTLRDCLDEEVPDKYYITDELFKKIMENIAKVDNLDLQASISGSTVMKENYIQWDSSGKGHFSQQDRAYLPDGIMGTLAASNNGSKHNVFIPFANVERHNKKQNGKRYKKDNDPMFCITTKDTHGIFDGCRIRRLMPRECLRLMGFRDDFKTDVADAHVYSQAGNGIVVDVLVALMHKVFNLTANERFTNQ